MSDFKNRFNKVVESDGKPGFKEEYNRLLDLLKTPNNNKDHSLKLWVDCCVEKTGRKVVKKTDPEYTDVKAYYINKKNQENK